MGDITRVRMPDWGMSMASGRIVEWIASVGDEIKEGDDLVEIDTDKIAGVLSSPYTGVLRRVVAQVGEDVPVGVCIALIADADVSEAELDAQARLAREELNAGAIIKESALGLDTLFEEGRAIA